MPTAPPKRVSPGNAARLTRRKDMNANAIRSLSTAIAAVFMSAMLIGAAANFQLVV